jgi:CubicO group peptidase (beta-lactamase class C family)
MKTRPGRNADPASHASIVSHCTRAATAAATTATATILAAHLLLASLASIPLLALPAADETTAKVDKLFAAWDKPTTPGAALAVIRDGRIVYERGYGMAKLEDGLAMTPDKVFDIGSVSKQFTAACVALLVREGKVGLDDDIRKHLPEMPAYEKPITVRHLIHHTSGLRDYNTLLSLAGFRPESDAPTVEEAYEIICRQKKLNYAPGEEYSYTNSGYFLLSRIVERASGKSLNEFAQERLFKPLGMAKTLYQDDHTQIIKDRATGYGWDAGRYVLSMSNWDMTGDGNVYTTVRDLARWDQAFYTDALGKGLTDMLQTTGALANGEKIDYAWGLVVSDYKGLKVVEHGGSWVGFRASIVRFPEQRFSVVVLANLETIDPTGLAFKVADIYLADRLKEPPQEAVKSAAAVKLPKAELEALAGAWQETRFGSWLVLSLKGDGLVGTFSGRTFPLAAVGPVRFVVPDNPMNIRFEVEAGADKGRVGRSKLSIGTRQEYVFEKAAPLNALSAKELEEYAGTYVSEELLGARYTLGVEKDKLRLEMRVVAPSPLQPMAPDKFALPAYGFNAEFTRGKDGKVTGFTVNAGRAAGIVFVKK